MTPHGLSSTASPSTPAPPSTRRQLWCGRGGTAAQDLGVPGAQAVTDRISGVIGTGMATLLLGGGGGVWFRERRKRRAAEEVIRVTEQHGLIVPSDTPDRRAAKSQARKTMSPAAAAALVNATRGIVGGLHLRDQNTPFVGARAGAAPGDGREAMHGAVAQSTGQAEGGAGAGAGPAPAAGAIGGAS